MNAQELADRITELLDEADSVQDAIAALAITQYTVWAASHCLTCGNFQNKQEANQ